MGEVLNWNDFVDSKYLSGYAIEKPVTVTLERVAKEQVTQPKTGQTDDKIILYWKGAKKGQILTKRVAKVLTVLNGMKQNAHEWIGSVVELYTTQEKHFGAVHPILNVRIKRN